MKRDQFFRWRFAALVSLAACADTTAVGAELPPETAYGYWEEEDSDQCLYSLDLRRDGVVLVASKDERLRGSFRLEPPKPGAQHDGVIHRKIDSDNGGVDCEGDSSSHKGSKASAFMRFDGTNTLFLCRDEVGDNCFGRFLRKR